jgi:mono/diheme cytochrome c family protein
VNSYTEKGKRKKAQALLPFAFFLIPFLALSTGCRQDMHDAPRYDPLEASAVLPGGASAQPLVEGTVARGFLHEDEHLYAGKVGGKFAESFPFPITEADLNRGEQRFNVYCAPCHGRTGEGNGMVVQRGLKQAASYHVERLRQMPPGYFFDVMTNGFGIMPDYRMQISPEDRWRIVAYVRTLQLSHHATTADVPPDAMPQLQRGGGAPAPAADAAPAGRGGGHQ